MAARFLIFLLVVSCGPPAPPAHTYPITYSVVEVKCDCPPNMYCMADHCLCKFTSSGVAIVEMTMKCSEEP